MKTITNSLFDVFNSVITMKNLSVFFLLCTLCNSAQGQITIPEIKNGSANNPYNKDSLVQSLLSNSQVIIMFRNYSAWEFDTPFRAIYYTKDGTWHYCKFTKQNGQRNIVQIDAPQDSIVTIWRAFADNDIFQIADEKKIKAKCDALIFDSQYFDFRIITKTKYKKLIYYDPQFYEEHCPGSTERQKIINCVKIIYTHYFNEITRAAN